jgi:cytochrome c
MKARALYTGTAVAALAVAGLSLIHPWGNLHTGDGPILAGANVPGPVREALRQKCGDCHSTNTRWPLYSRVAPASWLVEHDVHDGRQHMNLSSWEMYSTDARVDLLAKMATQLRQKKMPLKQYLLLHPEARLSESERKLLLEWTKAERKRLLSETAP